MCRCRCRLEFEQILSKYCTSLKRLNPFKSDITKKSSKTGSVDKMKKMIEDYVKEEEIWNMHIFLRTRFGENKDFSLSVKCRWGSEDHDSFECGQLVAIPNPCSTHLTICTFIFFSNGKTNPTLYSLNAHHISRGK